MNRRVWIASLLASCFLVGAATAQLGLPRTYQPRPDDTGLSFKIKRRSVSGEVKSVDATKKTLVLASSSKEVPVDVGPAIIRAGNGMATFADLQVGDKLSVYGETTVQGGIRAMTIQAPKERKSVEIPKKNAPLTAEEKAKVKEAKEAEREEAKAKAAAEKEAKKAREEEEKKRKAEEKAAREAERRNRDQ